MFAPQIFKDSEWSSNIEYMFWIIEFGGDIGLFEKCHHYLELTLEVMNKKINISTTNSRVRKIRKHFEKGISWKTKEFHTRFVFQTFNCICPSKSMQFYQNNFQESSFKSLSSIVFVGMLLSSLLFVSLANVMLATWVKPCFLDLNWFFIFNFVHNYFNSFWNIGFWVWTIFSSIAMVLACMWSIDLVTSLLAFHSFMNLRIVFSCIYSM